MTGRPGRGLDAAAQAFSPCPPGYKSRPAGCKSPHAQRRTHSRALKPLHGCLLTVAGTESQSWRDEKDQVFTAKSFKSTQQQFLRYTANSCRGQSPSRLLHTITSEEVRASAKHPAALRRGWVSQCPGPHEQLFGRGRDGRSPQPGLAPAASGPSKPHPRGLLPTQGPAAFCVGWGDGPLPAQALVFWAWMFSPSLMGTHPGDRGAVWQPPPPAYRLLCRTIPPALWGWAGDSAALPFQGGQEGLIFSLPPSGAR